MENITREIRPSSRDAGRLRNHFNIDKKRRTNQHFQPHAHYHPFYEFFYLIKGHCRFFIYHSSIELNAGDLLIIPPGQYHYNVYGKEPIHDRFALYFDEHFLTRELREQLPLFAESEADAAVFHVEKAVREHVLSTFEQMLSYYREASTFGDTILSYMFPAMLLYLSRHVYEPELRETSPITAAMQDTVKYIHTNYSENITLEGAAGTAGLAPTYFSRKFKEIVGTGFRDYLTFVRLREAAEMLRRTHLPVSEIARQCGFNSSNYFGDAFRAAYGMSPRQYRQSEEAVFMLSQQEGNPKVSL